MNDSSVAQISIIYQNYQWIGVWTDFVDFLLLSLRGNTPNINLDLLEFSNKAYC